MKFLVISATSIRSSDAPFLLADAFRRAGHAVDLLPIDSDLPVVPRAGWRAGGVADPVYRAWFQRRALSMAESLNPDVVLLYGSNWSLEPDTVQRFRYRAGAQVVLWEINQRLFGGAQAACLPLYDHVFCLDSYFLPVLKGGGVRCVEHLAAAADPREHRPLDLADDETQRYGADISFVGTYHPQRGALLARLDGRDLEVRLYGQGWEQAGSPVSEWVRNEPVYGRKKTVLYCASRLSFHERGPHMINGENFRPFEVAACGGVTITRPSPDLLDCFVPGEEVLTFDEDEDFEIQVSKWVKDPGRLASIGEAGRHRVLAEHTYDHRAAVICDHVGGGRH